MTRDQFEKQIEAIITCHKQVQQCNPPSSEQWQSASLEINRLAKLIVDSRKQSARVK